MLKLNFINSNKPPTKPNSKRKWNKKNKCYRHNEKNLYKPLSFTPTSAKTSNKNYFMSPTKQKISKMKSNF